jgi:hypothetical protein
MNMDIVDKKVNKILIIMGILFTVLSFISEIFRIFYGSSIHFLGLNFSSLNLIPIFLSIYFFIKAIMSEDHEFLVLNRDKISDNLRDIVLYGLLFLGVFVKLVYFLPTRRIIDLKPHIDLMNFEFFDFTMFFIFMSLLYFFIVIMRKFLEKYIHNKFVVIFLISFIYTIIFTIRMKIFPELFFSYFIYAFFQKLVITLIVYRSKHIYYGFIIDTFL